MTKTKNVGRKTMQYKGETIHFRRARIYQKEKVVPCIFWSSPGIGENYCETKAIAINEARKAVDRHHREGRYLRVRRYEVMHNK